MDDYFAILAARVTGSADAVRPLLPSRYEAAPKLLVPEDTGSDLVESNQAVTVPRTARSTDVPQPAVHRPEASSSPKLVNKNYMLERSPETSPPVQTIEAARIQPSAEDLPEPRQKPAYATKRKAVPAGETMEAESGTAIPRRVRIQKEPRAEADTTSTPVRARQPQPKPQEPSLHPAMYRRSRPLNGMDSRSGDAVHANKRFTPQTATASGNENPAKKGPDVHISIGRIEVHAVHPPAAAPATKRTAPSTVSLEDYLARRNATGP